MEFDFTVRLSGVVSADSWTEAREKINKHLDSLGSVDSGDDISWPDADVEIAHQD